MSGLTIVVPDLSGHKHCRIMVAEDGSATIEHLGHGDPNSPQVDDTPIGRERTLVPGNRITLVAVTGKRFEMVVEAGAPFVPRSIGPMPPPSRGVMRRAQKVLTTFGDHWMEVHADGVVVVTSHQRDSEMPIAAAWLDDAAVRALAIVGEGDATIAQLMKLVLDGAPSESFASWAKTLPGG
jgi:hypothetical protein